MRIDPDGTYNTAETSAFRGCSESKSEKDRLSGGGPRYFKDGHLVRYRGRDIIEHIESRLRSSTSDDAGQKAA